MERTISASTASSGFQHSVMASMELVLKYGLIHQITGVQAWMPQPGLLSSKAHQGGAAGVQIYGFWRCRR